MLPLVWTRFGQWQNLEGLKVEDFDYGNDGVMLPKGAEPFNKVWKVCGGGCDSGWEVWGCGVHV